MTVLAPSSTLTSRRPEVLLVSTLPAFVAYVAVAAATLATVADTTSAELTPAQVSGLGASWMLVHLLWMAPSVLAALGLSGLLGRERPGGADVRRLVVPATLGLAVLYVATQAVAYRVDTATWGDSGWYAVGVGLSLVVGWGVTIPATLLVTARLVREGVVPRAARVVAVLTGVYLLWEVATYVAIVVGPPTLIDTVGPPPFVLGLLWAGVGARLWWSRRSGKAVS